MTRWPDSRLHTDELRNRVLDANPDTVMSLRTRYAKPGEAPPAPQAEVKHAGGRRFRPVTDAAAR